MLFGGFGRSTSSPRLFFVVQLVHRILFKAHTRQIVAHIDFFKVVALVGAPQLAPEHDQSHAAVVHRNVAAQHLYIHIFAIDFINLLYWTVSEGVGGVVRVSNKPCCNCKKSDALSSPAKYSATRMR